MLARRDNEAPSSERQIRRSSPAVIGNVARIEPERSELPRDADITAAAQPNAAIPGSQRVFASGLIGPSSDRRGWRPPCPVSTCASARRPHLLPCIRAGCIGIGIFRCPASRREFSNLALGLTPSAISHERDARPTHGRPPSRSSARKTRPFTRTPRAASSAAVRL